MKWGDSLIVDKNFIFGVDIYNEIVLAVRPIKEAVL